MTQPRPGPQFVLVKQRVDDKWFFHAVGWNNEVGPVDHEAHDDEHHATRGAQDWWPGYEVRVEYRNADGSWSQTRTVVLPNEIVLGPTLYPRSP